VTPEVGKRLLEVKNAIVAHFTEEHWLELGALTGRLDTVRNDGRLLRSLSFGDDDYGGKAFSVLAAIVGSDPANIDVIEAYVSSNFPAGGFGISSIEAPGKRIYFTPSVFQVPATETELDLVSVMMPFGVAFGAVHVAVAAAADRNGMRCQRADDIWIHSTVVQDIFSLIYRSFIVVCDFTGKNPNVFYEAGIAHTLGKHVIPITQYPDHIPFDLQAHRYLRYLDNAEGHAKLSDELTNRIATLATASRSKPWGN
jgi:hypothetical protein